MVEGPEDGRFSSKKKLAPYEAEAAKKEERQNLDRANQQEVYVED